ncbi:hypothetical protein V1286_001355 [Bradyrhizobium algeriense]|uniref:Uncharacterized protein n=1 Tax=Bradyrhizobium algeriense TaxID=634784 RepID=A0ABU8B5K9_9BRAD
MKPISIVTTLVAGFAFVAAMDGAFARASTGTRPISTAAGKPFNINGGTGKGVGGEANAGFGGSAGGTTRPPSLPRSSAMGTKIILVIAEDAGTQISFVCLCCCERSLHLERLGFQ